MASSVFRFKQFSIEQPDDLGCKVGTDGVLLGAWASLPKGKRALDIGSGTGLISLILAQRSIYTIHAVELERLAYETTLKNFVNSPWSQRLQAIYSDIRNLPITERYDLIVSNPPFYSGAFLSEDNNRNLARNELSLPFRELLYQVKIRLEKTGYFSVVIPYEYQEKFIQYAKDLELYPFSILNTRGNQYLEIKRSYMMFSFQPREIYQKEMVIEKKRHIYSEEYTSMVKDFYLKM